MLRNLFRRWRGRGLSLTKMDKMDQNTIEYLIAFIIIIGTLITLITMLEKNTWMLIGYINFGHVGILASGINITVLLKLGGHSFWVSTGGGLFLTLFFY